MSMALFFTALTQQELDDVLVDKIDLNDIEDSAGLDLYSMEMIEYLPESESPLFALLTESESYSPLDKKVDFARLMDKNSVDNVVQAFHETDLNEFASDMGYPEEDEDNKSVENSLYKTLVKTQKFFEDAKANQKIVISWAM